MARTPPLALVEVHSENYFGGGAPRRLLEWVRTHYRISLHGVGMSLGGLDPISPNYLARLKQLADDIEPALVSDHACFTSFGGRHVHDLLPLPYTEEALAHLVSRIAFAQERLGRRLLIENPSAYVRYPHETLTEGEFLAEVVRRTGCGLLLDVNNLYVTSQNLGFDPMASMNHLPAEAICELHLAGHVQMDALLVDTHSAPVHERVWRLFREATLRFPAAPAVVEWDADIPSFSFLLTEVERASREADDALCHSSRIFGEENDAVTG